MKRMIVLAVLLTGCSDQAAPDAAHQGHTTPAQDGDILYYTCPMHPAVRQNEPGKCPLCGMDLTPVRRSEVESGVVVIDTARRQRIGVRTAIVERRALVATLRAVGEVRYDETRLSDVNLRTSGWVHKLYVDATGQAVRKGQALFSLYSPDLFSTQLEYLSARLAGDGGVIERAARQKLRLLGLGDSQVDALATRGEAKEHIEILSPASGYVIEKQVVEGARIEAGTRVYRIAALDRVWIEAQIYEADLPHVRVGQSATVGFTHVSGEPFAGKVAYVYPYLDETTRTGRIRIEVPNPKLALKPAMYAEVTLNADLGERLAVPEGAVIYTGPRRIVFVDLGEDRLKPQEVELGTRAGGYYEVLSGLVQGDVVVTSGNFLVSAESRIRTGAGDDHAGH